MTEDQAPYIIPRVRCPACRSTATTVYRTVGVIQYRRCDFCASVGVGTTFKTVREPADPSPERPPRP